MAKRKKYNPKQKEFVFEMDQMILDQGFLRVSSSRQLIEMGITLVASDLEGLSDTFSSTSKITMVKKNIFVIKEKDLAFPTISIKDIQKEKIPTHNDQLSFNFHGLSKNKVKNLKSINKIKDFDIPKNISNEKTNYKSTVISTSLFED